MPNLSGIDLIKRLRFALRGIEQGWSPLCDNTPADDDEWGVLKAGCVNGSALDESENKRLPETLEPACEYEIRAGDVLMSRANTTDLLGSAVHVGHVRPKLLLCDKLYRLRYDRETVHPVFLVYALRSHTGRAELEKEATGTSGSMQNIGQRVVQDARLPFPPFDEQHVIAAFLDRETARIDALVAAKRRLIALLHEKRAALIARAVTRGLDPDVPTKDSGVAWLGPVPAHWAVKRFRFVASVCEGQVDPEAGEISQMMLVAPNHVKSGTGRLIREETAEDQGAISGKYPVREGEVVYSKIRPALNKVWVADRDCMCSADMYPILCGTAILPAYLAAYMRSPGFLKLMVDESLRVAMPKVNRETLADAPIVVPPVDEQTAIMSEVNRATEQIDVALALASKTVARLTEYRSTLITSAVTGRIDVRAAA